ncbi:MAG TPA: response regulator [Stellaceae bacterium]|jgi:signal transduction histidine kinase|nr:response regulator [Stellaceae bacterium]
MTPTIPVSVTRTAPTILIVDDDPVFRSLTRDSLTDTGLTVIEAADGSEALSHCREFDPSLLLVDAVMPNLDGFALCRELRSRSATRRTPIVMVTGLQDHKALDRAYNAGATDFIVKPVEWGSLAQRVRYALRNAGEFSDFQNPSDGRRRGARPDDDGKTATGDGSARVSILIVDDDPVARAVMCDVLENEGYDVVEAEDGFAAYNGCLHTVPGLVITDAMMPGLSGFDLCRLLRRRAETEHVPILVITGLNDEQSVVDAYDAGATDFIVKSDNWQILKYRVRYTLRTARAAADLVSAKQRAEESDRAKSLLLANMSHELRTPLNAVIGFSEIMHQQMLGPLSAQYVEYAKIIGDSGSHLLTIINDLLDLATSDAKELKIANDPVNIPQVVTFSANMIGAMAKEAGVECRVEAHSELPAFRGDAKKLSQVLINLLTNAVKFTPAGGHVTIKAWREPAGGLVLRVEDTGVGIPRDKIQLALAPFGQIASQIGRKNGGVGLGLPLSKRLVELHDGTLEIASEPGTGTTVSARFPQERFIRKLV